MASLRRATDGSLFIGLWYRFGQFGPHFYATVATKTPIRRTYTATVWAGDFKLGTARFAKLYTYTNLSLAAATLHVVYLWFQ